VRAIQKPNLIAVLAAFLAAVPFATAQNKYNYADVEKKLEEKYTLTSINAEGGVVIQGVTLTLRMGGLTAGVQNTCANDYKGGKITLASASKGVCGASTVCKPRLGVNICSYVPGASQVSIPDTRPFTNGEKLYVTKIAVTDSVTLTLASAPVKDVTYKAEVRFAIPKGTSPDFAQADQQIAEVFSITAPDNSQGAQQAAQPAAAAPPAAASNPALAPIPPPPPPPQDPALAPIAPPAPPSDAPAAPPQTLGLGMTIDQVVAILGQPPKMATAGTKQIYSYKDLKVTFVDGKVTDIQ